MRRGELRNERNPKNRSIRYTLEKQNCVISELLVMFSLAMSGNMNLVPWLRFQISIIASVL